MEQGKCLCDTFLYPYLSIIESFPFQMQFDKKVFMNSLTDACMSLVNQRLPVTVSYNPTDSPLTYSIERSVAYGDTVCQCGGRTDTSFMNALM